MNRPIKKLRFVVPALLAISIGMTATQEASAAEPKAQRQSRKALANLDTNSDGKLDIREFTSGLKDEKRERFKFRFKRSDKNGDGFISYEELLKNWQHLRNELRPKMYQYEKIVTEEEAASAPDSETRLTPGARTRVKRQVMQTMKKLDQNEDGKLIRREFLVGYRDGKKASFAGFFDSIDKDGNDKLKPGELVESWNRVKNKLKPSVYQLSQAEEKEIEEETASEEEKAKKDPATAKSPAAAEAEADQERDEEFDEVDDEYDEEHAQIEEDFEKDGDEKKYSEKLDKLDARYEKQREQILRKHSEKKARSSGEHSGQGRGKGRVNDFEDNPGKGKGKGRDPEEHPGKGPGKSKEKVKGPK